MAIPGSYRFPVLPTENLQSPPVSVTGQPVAGQHLDWLRTLLNGGNLEGIGSGGLAGIVRARRQRQFGNIPGWSAPPTSAGPQTPQASVARPTFSFPSIEGRALSSFLGGRG